MPDREREIIGPFVVTSQTNLSDGGITCAQCNALLAQYDATSDSHDPTPVQLLASGAVPVPNFGWFCSQACAVHYEASTGIRFERGLSGRINYYDEA